MGSEKQRCTPSPLAQPVDDPGGLDKVFLAIGDTAGKSVHDFMASKLAGLGIKVDWWNGDNGLQKVLQESIQSAIDKNKIPNKRFGELITPRSVAESLGAIPRRRKVAR